MIRDNLPMAMQGLAVVPIYAGYDLRRRIGRIFKYDITGGRYEETDFHATGSGGRDARTTIKLGYRKGLDRAATIELAVEGLYQAADEDSATGGPDAVRGIYPTVATITAAGFERVRTPRWPSASRPDRPHDRGPAQVSAAKGESPMSMPFYVAPEQVMKDRADYARKGIARGRSLVALSYDHGILLCAENPSRTLHKVAEIYDRIAFAGVGKFSEFDSLRTAGIRHADLKGYSYSREDVDARSPGQRLRPAPGQRVHPRDEAHGGRDPGGRGRLATLAADQLFRISYDGTVVDEEQLHRPRRRRRRHLRAAQRGRPPTTPPSTWAAPCGGRCRPWPVPTAPSPRASWRWPSSTGPRPAAPSAASPRPSSSPS